MYKEHTIIEMDDLEIVLKRDLCNKTSSKKTICLIVMLILLCSCVLSTESAVILKRKQEPKKIQSEFNNLAKFTLFELIDEVKKMNISVDSNHDIRTRDVSKIDKPADAASFLFSNMQTFLGKIMEQQKLEPPACIHIVNSTLNVIYSTVNISNNNQLRSDR